MNKCVTVTRPTGELSQWVWEFYFLDGDIVLDRFEEQSRQSKRHKFRCGKFYTRLENRKSTMKLDDVPWSADIMEEALQAIVSRLTVVKQQRSR